MTEGMKGLISEEEEMVIMPPTSIQLLDDSDHPHCSPPPEPKEARLTPVLPSVKLLSGDGIRHS